MNDRIEAHAPLNKPFRYASTTDRLIEFVDHLGDNDLRHSLDAAPLSSQVASTNDAVPSTTRDHLLESPESLEELQAFRW